MKYQLNTNKKENDIHISLIEKKKDESLSPRQSVYRNYLKSVTWKHLRDEALSYYNNTCQRCKGEGKDVHHVYYPEQLGMESVHDLLVLCRKCHDLEHTYKSEPKKVSSYAQQRIHVRAITAFLSDEDSKKLSGEYPDIDLHELLISNTDKGEEARQKALKILNIKDHYGVDDFVKKETPVIKKVKPNLKHRQSTIKQQQEAQMKRYALNNPKLYRKLNS